MAEEHRRRNISRENAFECSCRIILQNLEEKKSRGTKLLSRVCHVAQNEISFVNSKYIADGV